MEKRRRLWWTPCVAHCIDLMLEDIEKLNVHGITFSRTRQVVKFMYGHTWVLSLMRTFTKNLGNNMDVQLCQIVGQMERVGVLSIFS